MTSFDVIKISCTNAGRVLSELTRAGVRLKKAVKEGSTLLVHTYYKDRSIIFALLKKLCYNYEVVKTYGFFRTLKRLLTRWPISVALAAVLIVVALLPFYTVRVEISGAYATLDGVNGVLDEHGVVRGAFTRGRDYGDVERALSELNGVAFASVYKRGGAVYVTLIEELPKEELFYLTEQREVRSLYDAVITRQVVLSGTSATERGQTVRAGEVVIDGYATVGEERIPTAARGEVYGLVYYTATAVFTPTVLTAEPTGESTSTHNLSFLGLTGRAAERPYESCYAVTEVKTLGVLFPMTVTTVTYYETEWKVRNVAFSEQEAALTAEALFRALESVPVGARVTDKWTTVKNQNGTYVVEAVVEAEQRIDDGNT